MGPLHPARVFVLIAIALVLGFILGYAFRGAAPQSAPPAAAGAPPRETIPPGQPVIGFLDQVDHQTVLTVAEGGNAVVSGWAGCANPSSPVATLEILVDGKPTATAAVSLPRPDVAEAFGRPDFARSGWKTSFVAQGLQPGTYPITARVTCAGGEAGTLPAFQLVVKAP